MRIGAAVGRSAAVGSLAGASPSPHLSPPPLPCNAPETSCQLDSPPPLPCNAPETSCQLEREHAGQPEGELVSRRRMGTLTTDTEAAWGDDSSEAVICSNWFGDANPIPAQPVSTSAPRTAAALEFRPQYAKGLYLSCGSASHATAQPISSWSSSDLMHWLSFEVRLPQPCR